MKDICVVHATVLVGMGELTRPPAKYMPAVRVLALFSHCGFGKRKSRCSPRAFAMILVRSSGCEDVCYRGVMRYRRKVLAESSLELELGG